MDVNGNGIPDNRESVPAQFDMNRNGVDDRYEGYSRRGRSSAGGGGSLGIGKVLMGVLVLGIIALAVTVPAVAAVGILALSAAVAGKLAYDYYQHNKAEKDRQNKPVEVNKKDDREGRNKDNTKEKTNEITVVKAVPLSKRRENKKENGVSAVKTNQQTKAQVASIANKMHRQRNEYYGRGMN